MKIGKLTTKSFTTKDTRGCDFHARGYYTYEYYRLVDTLYVAVGFDVEAKTLKELKIKMGNL